MSGKIGKKPTEHGFFDACVASGKSEELCASIKDKAYGSTKWRGKDKPKSEMPTPKNEMVDLFTVELDKVFETRIESKSI